MEFNRGTRLTLRATPRQLTAVAELTEIVRSISRRIAEVGLGEALKNRTISEFTTLRHEMRATAERVPAGV